MRTADGLGVSKLYLTGYTPYPKVKGDKRLPHIHAKQSGQIHKTALGAEDFLNWEHHDKISLVLERLTKEGYELLALEQTSQAVALNDFRPSLKIALLIGSEIGGLQKNLLNACQTHLRIPMLGRKQSLNVATAAAIGLYHLRYAKE